MAGASNKDIDAAMANWGKPQPKATTTPPPNAEELADLLAGTMDYRPNASTQPPQTATQLAEVLKSAGLPIPPDLAGKVLAEQGVPGPGVLGQTPEEVLRALGASGSVASPGGYTTTPAAPPPAAPKGTPEEQAELAALFGAPSQADELAALFGGRVEAKQAEVAGEARTQAPSHSNFSDEGPSFAEMAAALGTAPPTPEDEAVLSALFAATPGLQEAFTASTAVAQQQPSEAEIAAMFGTPVQTPAPQQIHPGLPLVRTAQGVQIDPALAQQQSQQQYPQVTTHEHEAWQIRDDGEGPYCTVCGEWVQTSVQTPPTDPNDPWANSPERRPTAGGPILYFFTEDQGNREDCSIFYSRRIVVERPPGGKAQIDAALDVILKRKLGGTPYLVNIGKAQMLPDWNDPAVEAMVGPGGNVNLLVAALAQYGITAYSVESDEQVES